MEFPLRNASDAAARETDADGVRGQQSGLIHKYAARNGDGDGSMGTQEHKRRVQHLGHWQAWLPFVVSFISGMSLFIIIPATVLAIRRSHVSDLQFERDGWTLNSMVSFRDILWEIWSTMNAQLRKDWKGYAIWAIFMYLINFTLWWVWYPIRHFRHRVWSLALKLHLLLALSLICNCVSWFPLPPGFLQNEPLGVTYISGFVVRSAHQFVSPRVAWSMVLVHDAMKSFESHWLLRGGVITLYGVVVCLFLWATRQMYSFSLAVNVLAAVAAWYVGEDCVARVYYYNARQHAKGFTDPTLEDSERLNPVDDPATTFTVSIDPRDHAEDEEEFNPRQGSSEEVKYNEADDVMEMTTTQSV
ncbi:MAG: hypothetical protein JKY23_06000 [Nitrospinaceae bacterium]|nr:hypothetical protein [Nitrospinaceae bacterium]